jgi:hypothetical protein
MDSKDVIADGLSRIHRSLHLTLEGMPTEHLIFRPGDQANTIGWLAWHLTRVQDHHLSDMAACQQAWIADRWHEKFGKPADPLETGQRYTPEQVAEIRPASAQLLLDYHDAVYQRSLAYVNTLAPADFDRELDEPQYSPLPTVGVRLVSVLGDNLQHAGQAAYLKGLIENRRWFPA